MSVGDARESGLETEAIPTVTLDMIEQLLLDRLRDDDNEKLKALIIGLHQAPRPLRLTILMEAVITLQTTYGSRA